MDIIFVGGEPFKPLHWPFHTQCLSSSLLLLSLHKHHWIHGIQITLNSWNSTNTELMEIQVFLHIPPKSFSLCPLPSYKASSTFLGTYYSSTPLLVLAFCLSSRHLGHVHIFGVVGTIQHTTLNISHPVSCMVLALRFVTHKYLLKWRTHASVPLFRVSSFASIQGSHHLPDTAGWMSPPPSIFALSKMLHVLSMKLIVLEVS